MPASHYPAWSIDFDNKARIMGGWLAPTHTFNNAHSTVTIQTFKGKSSTVSPVDMRLDVLSNDIHATGSTGFSFAADIAQLGDLVSIQFQAENLSIKQKTLYGSKEAWVREFAQFEVPRDDMSVLEKSTAELLTSGPDLLNLKLLIVRLRRAKRARSSIGRFVGVPHDHIATDLHALKSIVTRYFKVVSEVITARYLWSILDCLADYGNPEESLRAFGISSMMHIERMGQTINCLYSLQPLPADQQTRLVQKPYWGGMLTNRLSKDDSLDIFLTRAKNSLSPDPLIYAIFCRIILDAASSPNSYLAFNLANSPWLMDAFAPYRREFQDHVNVFNNAG
jgi:hypothetical protein